MLTKILCALGLHRHAGRLRDAVGAYVLRCPHCGERVQP